MNMNTQVAHQPDMAGNRLEPVCSPCVAWSYDLSGAASEVAKLKVELPDCAKVWAPSKHVGVLHTKNPQRDNES